jgi:hypothetical protein
MRFWQVGLVVPQLEPAMAELADGLGLEWEEPRTRTIGDWQVRSVHSRPGSAPRFELVERAPGTPWDASGRFGLDHIAYFSDAYGVDAQRLSDAGFATEVDADALGASWRYVRGAASGLRVETIDVVRHPEALARFSDHAA